MAFPKASGKCVAAHLFQHSRNLLRVSAIIFSALSSHAQTLTITPTTTLAKETANNTSASSAFKTLTNGVVAPGNVSKVRTGSLLYSGSSTQIYAHFMGWFGGSGHINVGYQSNVESVVSKQVGDMASRGIAGAIIDWYGAGTISDQTTHFLMAAAEKRTGFRFAITEDVGALSASARANNCDVTQKLIDDLNYAYTTYELSPAYLRISGRPVVFFFGVEAYFIDWKRVRAEVAGSPLFIFRNSGAFGRAESDGGFGWLAHNQNDPYDMQLGYLDNFYLTALAHPGKHTFGSGYPGFNDTVAGWTGHKVMDQQCGQTWLRSLAQAGKFYSAAKQLAFLQLVTWNDYEEGTALETGIDNCLTVVASMSPTNPRVLTWKLEGKGSENTIYYYRVFISTDGQNLMRLKDIAPGKRTLDLSTFRLAPRTYTFYVKAEGKPSIQNRVSGPVTYHPTDRAPLAKLSLSTMSGSVPLTITASTHGSTDPDGRVISSKINFGDGTVVSGPVATHTYQSFGAYTVTASVYDNLNVFSSVTKTVQVKPTRSGVIISSPANGSITGNIVRLAATASAANPITAMAVYLDNKAAYRLRGDRIDTFLKMFDGTHKLTVNAWDTAGKVSSGSISIKVGLTANQPPLAALTLSSFSTSVAAPVRACTAASSDPESGVSSVIDFGDGSSLIRGPFGSHAYSRPGTYTVKATVTDSRGASSATTKTVTVQ